MAAKRPKNNHEEIRVKVEQTKREVLPAVELEKKEIKMKIMPAPPGKAVPSILMTAFENGSSETLSKTQDAGRIVGIDIGPLTGEMTTTESGVPKIERNQTTRRPRETKQTPTSPKFGSRLTVEQTTSIIEKTENLMEFFQDHDKKGLTKRTTTKKPRTPSPSPVRQSIGLDHLDNLVRLMEQLSNLKDENSRLKHRCDYLESTKSLLQEKSKLDDESILLSYQSDSLPRSKKGKSKSTKSSHSEGDGIRFVRPRLPSAEDAKFIEFDLGDSSSDQTPKRPKGTLFKRSFSTGSLEVPSDIMEQSGEDEIGSQHLLTDPFERKLSSKMSKSPEAKRKSKFSKWAKVKKVLTKQQLSENISSGIKSIKGLGKGAYFRYGSVSGRELAVPSVAESRSVDSGVGSGMDGELQDVRKSTSSGEPPSPTRFIERHIDVPTPQIDDCMGIWLGPPEWIEKEREKEQQLLKQSGALSESPKSEPGDIGSPHSVSCLEEEGEKFLQVPIPRRQSSPLLLDEPDDDEEFEAHITHTSSFKEHDIKETEESFHKIEKGEKKHKTAWGKMKNIIHTRKDSVKKKRKGRESDSFGFEEVSETDFEVSDEMRYVHEGYLEGPVSRSTPKTSPVVFRQKHRDKSLSPPNKGQEQTGKVPTSGGSIDVSALMGGISDEFTKKLQEWEELKGKRASGHYKESSEFSESVSYESAGAVSPEFLKKLEEWEKVKSLKGIPVVEKKPESQVEGEGESSSDEIEEVSTPPDRQRQSINVDEIQRKLTDSFSRKMEEWERQKYRRQNSQTSEIKDVSQKTSFKDRPKSKKTKEEKEREKIEKLREREFLRVEREQQKLEKERIRIEKERLKALEREAKIEKMKGRLSQPDMDTKLKNPILSPLTEYKVTADFARKLHEWEVMKGKGMTTAMYLEAQKRSLQFSMEYQNATNMLSKNGHQEATSATTDTDDQQPMRKTSSESDEMFLMEEQEKVSDQPLKKGEKPAPLTLIPYFESPEPSPGAPASDTSSLDDQTTETMESMTQANIMSLEKANNQLLFELREREFEYDSLQEEVRDLNERLMTFRQEHALELEMYKKQMMEGVPPRQMITLETRHMTQTLTHLEEKIGELKKFGEQLAMSMEGAAVGKFQTVEGEESINNRLVDLLDKMRLLLQQATKTGENTLEEVSKKSSALHNFEKLYSQAMQLQVQMNNLRLSQLERNKEIMMMKRQLLLQEANNLILQADVTRREADLLYYKEYAQKRIPIKRWNTYSGKEDRGNIPDQDTPQKQSIFQRVQRLRSIRPLTSSTTDSDSDVPSKSSPARRESPRVRKRESPKLRKKESPKTFRRESPSSRRKESPALKRRESPSLRRKESPTITEKELATIQPRSSSDLYALEKSIERREEHVRTDSLKRLSGIRESSEVQFSTVTLPTAKVTLPKDISPHEINGVPRSSREKSDSPPTLTKSDKDVINDDKKMVKEKVKSEIKFPELLIPEWKKVPPEDRKTHLQRMPSIERDDVFESDNEDIIVSKKATVQTSEVVTSKKVKIQEMAKLAVDVSFDSSETSEDTLKYLSPEASPAPQVEPPKFPTDIKVNQKSPFDNETVSDPGQSRPNSMVRVAIEPPRTPVLLRRPPLGQSASRFQSSKLNIPVIPLRRIKPAQELLEDSQKYRSGHSIYLTRILKRYPMKIECRSRSLEDRQNADRGNIKAGYVKAMVKQLSREGTPDSRKSSPKLQLSLEQQSFQEEESHKQEFVQHIVHKLSSPSGPSSEKPSSALKELTNDGQVRTLREAFANGSACSLSEKGSDGNGHFVSVVIKSRGSQDMVACSHSSSSTSTITFSQLSTRTSPGIHPDSTISSKVTYSSMPLLNLEGTEAMRDRSATTSNGSGGATPAQTSSYSPKDSPSSQRHRIHVAVSMSPGRSRRVIDPSMSPARLRRLIDPASPGRRRRIQEPSPIEQVVEEPLEASVSVAQSEAMPSTIEHVPRRSPKTKYKQQSEMGTIGVLCRQSMTFDLGVSLQGDSGAEGGGQGEESRSQPLPIRHSTSSTTSTSSQSEVETVSGSSKEKKKSRNKFLDSAFIQKSKKFFRVSNR